jgi:hypothetical protein
MVVIVIRFELDEPKRRTHQEGCYLGWRKPSVVANVWIRRFADTYEFYDCGWARCEDDLAGILVLSDLDWPSFGAAGERRVGLSKGHRERDGKDRQYGLCGGS